MRGVAPSKGPAWRATAAAATTNAIEPVTAATATLTLRVSSEARRRRTCTSWSSTANSARARWAPRPPPRVDPYPEVFASFRILDLAGRCAGTSPRRGSRCLRRTRRRWTARGGAWTTGEADRRTSCGGGTRTPRSRDETGRARRISSRARRPKTRRAKSRGVSPSADAAEAAEAADADAEAARSAVLRGCTGRGARGGDAGASSAGATRRGDEGEARGGERKGGGGSNETRPGTSSWCDDFNDVE